MFHGFAERLERLRAAGSTGVLRGGLVGLERETLRIRPDGFISQAAHPSALGAALTHRFITTDFSEALLEFVTPPLPDTTDALRFLERTHRFVHEHLDGEFLWPASMPCWVKGDGSIPIARYGSSNVGRMKHVYRQGLALRYGRAMQVIAGVHFNYSANEALWQACGGLFEADDTSDATSTAYFGLLRNFQRLGWVVPYLFGASPAVCKSFLRERAADLVEFDAGTWYRPHATSLRMSEIGYRNANQRALNLSYDSLGAYTESLSRATHRPFADYERLGVVVDGERRQLNANLLQIENESYGIIRPKQIARSGERPSAAMRRGGVAYVEVRALDLNPFEPLGVSGESMRFIEALLLLCLLDDSPPIGPVEAEEIEANQRAVTSHGRDPALTLTCAGQPIGLGEWLEQICAALRPLCAILDEGRADGTPYIDALDRQLAAAKDPTRTPSSRVLAQMKQRGESFFGFALRQAQEQAALWRSRPAPDDLELGFEEEAARSLVEQAEIEASDSGDFEEYLRDYFGQ